MAPSAGDGDPTHHRSGRSVDVLVAGAGYAGLTAARALVRAGADVLVAEARPRVGGRVWSERTPGGTVVDHGGQWLGPGQDHLLALAAEFGVETFPTWTTGEHVEHRDGTARRYVGLVPTSDPAAAADGIEAILDLDLAATEVSLDEPWAHPDAARLDQRTLGSWLDAAVAAPAARGIVDLAVKAIFGTETGEMSLLFAMWYLHAGGGLMNLARTTGGAQERRFSGGAQQMALAVAEELGDRVHCRSPVTAIHHGAEGVTVTAAGLGVVRAERLVVAMAPALWSRIAWDPALPGLLDGLAQRAPMGSVTKVHCVYDAPFWRDEGLSGQVLSDAGALRVTFDDSPEDGGAGVLVGFVAGDECRRMEAAGPAARRAAVLADLARYFGPRAGAPREYVEQHWPAEPYTRGGPVAVFAPGLLTGYGPALRRPHGAVHFCGTETATRWTGYIDGAISSGERAAAEVLAALGRGPAS